MARQTWPLRAVDSALQGTQHRFEWNCRRVFGTAGRVPPTQLFLSFYEGVGRAALAVLLARAVTNFGKQGIFARLAADT